MPANSHDWSRLNSLQLGKYAEYLAKMEFVLSGCDVFTSEVDDHGIDFVVRTRAGNHYDIQVKSSRAGKYVFVRKEHFKISPSFLLAVVRFTDGEPPSLYLVPSSVDNVPNPILESRDYGEGRKSPPEWGLTLSKKKLQALADGCRFGTVIEQMV